MYGSGQAARRDGWPWTPTQETMAKPS
jgi:hypothetical protein